MARMPAIAALALMMIMLAFPARAQTPEDVSANLALAVLTFDTLEGVPDLTTEVRFRGGYRGGSRYYSPPRSYRQYNTVRRPPTARPPVARSLTGKPPSARPLARTKPRALGTRAVQAPRGAPKALARGAARGAPRALTRGIGKAPRALSGLGGKSRVAALGAKVRSLAQPGRLSRASISRTIKPARAGLTRSRGPGVSRFVHGKSTRAAAKRQAGISKRTAGLARARLIKRAGLSRLLLKRPPQALPKTSAQRRANWVQKAQLASRGGTRQGIIRTGGLLKRHPAQRIMTAGARVRTGQMLHGKNGALRKGRNPGCSFHGDTLVLAERGLVAIKDIRPGDDRVWARDELTDKEGWREVKAIHRGWHRYAWEISVREARSEQHQSIVSSGLHPFYVHGVGWLQAKKLVVGQQLANPYGDWSHVVGVKRLDATLEATNLSVAEFQTFFVSASLAARPLWVHNGTSCDLKTTRYGAQPEKVRRALDETISGINAKQKPPAIHKNGWGKRFDNKDGLLPKTAKGKAINYREYDLRVDVKTYSNKKASTRGTYRIIKGGGNLYLTRNHYGDKKKSKKEATFERIKIEPGSEFGRY